MFEKKIKDEYLHKYAFLGNEYSGVSNKRDFPRNVRDLNLASHLLIETLPLKSDDPVYH